MIEHNYISKALRRFFIIPLDKQGKDPTKSSNKRPIALLSPLMKLLELVLVRRIIPKVESGLSEDQYAYQRSRSTEVMLSDLDRFASENRAKKRYTYIVGLDIAGAFDSASLEKLTETLLYYRVPEILTRVHW